MKTYVWEVVLHIFIDESGTFAPETHKRHSISAVGSLVIPSSGMKGFEKLYGRLRKRLPKTKGEVKGRNLSENDVVQLARLLRKVGALFEVVVVDMSRHSKEDLLHHKRGQEEAVTAHLTSDHHPELVEEVWKLHKQLENMPLQLYVQSAAMGELVYLTLNHADTYYAYRNASELGKYHWRIDAKDRQKVTPWEQWWSVVVLPMLESHSFREPLIIAEGGDYRWHDRFRKIPNDYKLQFVKDPRKSYFHDLKMVLTEDFRFSAEPEFGLEAVDIVTNTVRRSLSGNFRQHGWRALPQLMIHRNTHYITLITLSQETPPPHRLPYSKVIDDFRLGGRVMLPEGIRKKLPEV